MRRTRLLRAGLLAFLLVLAALTIAACPGDEEATTTSAAVTTTAAETTTTLSATTTTAAVGMTGPFVVTLSGDEEVPPVQTDASGTFTVELGAPDTTGTDTTLGTDTTESATGTTEATGTTDAGGVTTTTAATGTDTTSAGGVLGAMAINWTLEVESITDAAAAHIHAGAPGENGPVLITLFGGPPKAGEFSGVLAEGTLSLADIQPVEGMTPQEILGLIQSGGTYVNVHTAQNPGGEIRGQLVFVPGAGETTTTLGGTGTDTTESMGTTTSS